MRNILVANATLANPERVVAPALNTWTRLEPLPQSTDLQPALQASIADPLWLLARQWQFLEHAGEDAGTPIEVRVDAEAAPLSRYLAGALGADAATRGTAYAGATLPLEVAVEREPVREAHVRFAADAGLHLQRLLATVGPPNLPDAFLAAYPLDLAPAADAGADTLGSEWRVLWQGRALDGRKLATALAPLRDASGKLTALPPTPALPPGQQSKALEALRRWLAWYDETVVDTAASDAWIPGRLEYAFATSARVTGGEITLAADEYADGDLDWFAVDAVAPSLGTTAPPPAAVHLRPTLPAPVEYPGKPADRFWEFEDAAVHFGAMTAGPTDLTRLLLVEFALIYGNDWFIVPVRLPVGSLARLTSVSVRDTFGVVSQIARSRNVDGTTWSLFEIGGSGNPAQKVAARDFLFLPPTLVQTIVGEPVEEVALFRDEMANLAWGVERRVQGASGEPYDRHAEATRRAAQQQLSGPPVDAQLVYRLATSVPEHWIPLVPVPAEGSNPGTNPVIQLQRRALLRTETDGQRRAIQPKGVLLRTDPRQAPDAERPLRIEEEEVPREGAVVTRAFQFARWFDGRSLLWLGRRKRSGRGEGFSGLEFDVIAKG
jgi:hypothetical protein